MGYFRHLAKNWRVSWHSLGDVFKHFIHGVIPIIKFKHYHGDTKSLEVV